MPTAAPDVYRVQRVACRASDGACCKKMTCLDALVQRDAIHGDAVAQTFISAGANTKHARILLSGGVRGTGERCNAACCMA